MIIDILAVRKGKGENMSSTIDIKISKYRANGAKIFTGRDNGVKAREELNLNRIDEEDVRVRILVPRDTWGINPSFFGGMFEGSIKKLGRKFEDKYCFCYAKGESLNDSLFKDIQDDIDYIIENIRVEE